MNSRNLLIGCVVLAAGSLTLGFAWQSQGNPAVLALLIGLAWALPELAPGSTPTQGSLQSQSAFLRNGLDFLRADWLGSAWFGLTGLLALWWIFSGGGWWLAMAAVAAGLAAWDLGAFRQRVFRAGAIAGRTGLVAYRTAAAETDQACEINAYSREIGETIPAEYSDEATLASAPAQSAEHSAFDRAHLRALGWTSLAGLVCALLLYLAAVLMRFSFSLGLAVGISLALLAGVLLLARLLNRIS